MADIVKRFDGMKKELPNLSDETLALLVIAELLNDIKNNAVVWEPKQFCKLMEKMDNLSIAVHGEGQMIEKMCAESVTNDQE